MKFQIFFRKTALFVFALVAFSCSENNTSTDAIDIAATNDIQISNDTWQEKDTDSEFVLCTPAFNFELPSFGRTRVPAIDDQGNMIISSGDSVYKISTSLLQMWVKKVSDSAVLTPSVLRDDKIYVAASNGIVTSFFNDAHGTERWSINLADKSIKFAPLSISEKQLIIASSGTVALINEASDNEAYVYWNHEVDVQFQPIGVNKTVYMNTQTELFSLVVPNTPNSPEEVEKGFKLVTTLENEAQFSSSLILCNKNHLCSGFQQKDKGFGIIIINLSELKTPEFVMLPDLQSSPVLLITQNDDRLIGITEIGEIFSYNLKTGKFSKTVAGFSGFSPPVAGSDGILYFVGNTGDSIGFLALDNAFKMKFSTQYKGKNPGALTIKFPGIVIFPVDNMLYGLHCSGNAQANSSYPKFLLNLQNNNVFNE